MSNRDIHAIERYWQTLTLSSNALFNADEFGAALSSYQCALASAELLNNHLADCIRLEVPVMQVYIISCNNLANTYVALAEFEQADRLLKRVLYYLLHLFAHTQLNQNEVQSELKRATLAYQQFAEKTNMEKHERTLFFDLFKEQLFESE